MKHRRWPVTVLALMVGGGCGALNPPRAGDLVPTSWESSEESSYQKILTRYSDHAESYAGLDTRMFVAATFQSPAFREARLRRQAEFERQPREWLEKTLQQELNDSAQFYDVMLGVHINENQFEDMNPNTTVWRMALMTGAGEVNPVKIERIGKGNSVLSAYYPWLDPFWVLYRVRFPRALEKGGELVPPGTQKVTFKIASPLARVEMSFPPQ